MVMIRLLVIVGFLLTVDCTVPKGMSKTVASSQHLKIPSKGNAKQKVSTYMLKIGLPFLSKLLLHYSSRVRSQSQNLDDKSGKVEQYAFTLKIQQPQIR